MITVKNASYHRGYTSVDHLLTDSDFDALVGCQFRSVADAKRAAGPLRTYPGEQAPIALEVTFADGTTKHF